MEVLHRITTLIRHNGWSEREFLRRLGMNEGALRDWRSGKSSTYKKHLNRIAAILGTSTDYLSGETENPHEQPQNGMIAVPVFLDLPAQGGNGIPIAYESVEKATLESEAHEYAYLVATDDSMSPLILLQDKALVRLGECGDDGKVSVISIDDGPATMRRVKRDKSGSITLTCVNPYYPPKSFPKEEAGRIRALGRVIRILREL